MSVEDNENTIRVVSVRLWPTPEDRKESRRVTSEWSDLMRPRFNKDSTYKAGRRAAVCRMKFPRRNNDGQTGQKCTWRDRV